MTQARDPKQKDMVQWIWGYWAGLGWRRNDSLFCVSFLFGLGPTGPRQWSFALFWFFNVNSLVGLWISTGCSELVQFAWFFNFQDLFGFSSLTVSLVLQFSRCAPAPAPSTRPGHVLQRRCKCMPWTSGIGGVERGSQMIELRTNNETQVLGSLSIVQVQGFLRLL